MCVCVSAAKCFVVVKMMMIMPIVVVVVVMVVVVLCSSVLCFYSYISLLLFSLAYIYLI